MAVEKAKGFLVSIRQDNQVKAHKEQGETFSRANYESRDPYSYTFLKSSCQVSLFTATPLLLW